MDERVHVVAGNSADTSKYWYKIFKGIRDYGFKVYCVNPKIGEADGAVFYPDLDSLPEKGEVLILVARPDVSAQLARRAAESGYKEIWFQPGTYDETAAAMAINAGVTVHDECFMVYNNIW